MGKLCGGLHGLVEDSNVVVFFQRTHNATEHDHALQFRGFFDLDYLKAASQSRVLLKIFLVLRPGGGGDGTQFAAGQCRLEQVGRVALPRRTTGADHGVSFVDEKDDGSGRRLDLFDEPLQTILKFSLDAGTGLEEREIERTDSYVFQRRGDIAGGYTQGKAFDDSGFADAGFAGENRIVLAAASEDIDDLANFVVAAEHGIDFSGAGVGGEIDGKLLQ